MGIGLEARKALLEAIHVQAASNRFIALNADVFDECLRNRSQAVLSAVLSPTEHSCHGTRCVDEEKRKVPQCAQGFFG
jgi:hypothetical protein